MGEAPELKALGSIQDHAQQCQESQKLRNIKTFDPVVLSRPLTQWFYQDKYQDLPI